MILQIEQTEKGLRYYSDKGSSLSPQSPEAQSFRKRGKIQLLLNINQCPMLSLYLPPLKESDLHLLVERQIPTRFPAPMEDWKWHMEQVENETRVFLMPKDLLHQLERDWAKGFSLFSPGQSIPPPAEDKKVVYLFEGITGHDLFFYNRGTLDHAIHIDNDEEIPHLVKEFTEQDPILLDPGKLPSRGLFRSRKNRKKGSFILALPLCIPLLLLFPWQKEQKLQEQWMTLEQQRQQMLTQSSSETLSLPWDEIEELLSSNQPEDRYGQLEILYPLFYRRSQLISYHLQEKDFQISARAENPLPILEELKQLPQLEMVQLYQSREQEDQEIFQFSGRWK